MALSRTQKPDDGSQKEKIRVPPVFAIGKAALFAPIVMAAIGLCTQAARAEGNLTVCLNEDIPLYSLHRGNEASGFDLKVAEAIAKRLDRKLIVQWFETKLEMDSSLTIDANALLSTSAATWWAAILSSRVLGSRASDARLPGFDGNKPEDRRRRVTLGELPTRPYHRSVLAVVWWASVTKPITALADLEGLKIGIEAARWLTRS